MTKGIAPYLLVLPAVLLIAMLILGLSSVLGWSFTGAGSEGGASLSNFERLIMDGYYRYYFTYSMWLAVVSTAIALVLGFPVAYYMEVVATNKTRKMIFACLLAVFLSDYVLRMFALILILGRSGLINSVALWLGVSEVPFRLMFNEFGVMVGLITGVLPFMILTLSGVVARLDGTLREAAGLLGAPAWRAFVSVTLPLCFPGIIAGTMLCFLLSLNSFVTPVLLGGGRVDMIAVFIFDQAINLANMPIGSAAAVILFLLAAATVVLLNLFSDRYMRRFQK